MAKKTLGEKQFETYKDSADAVLMKAKRLNKSYKGSSPVNKAKMEKKHDLKKMFKESRKASKQDAARTHYKHGGAAIRGLGRAFMKGGKV